MKRTNRIVTKKALQVMCSKHTVVQDIGVPGLFILRPNSVQCICLCLIKDYSSNMYVEPHNCYVLSCARITAVPVVFTLSG